MSFDYFFLLRGVDEILNRNSIIFLALSVMCVFSPLKIPKISINMQNFVQDIYKFSLDMVLSP